MFPRKKHLKGITVPALNAITLLFAPSLNQRTFLSSVKSNLKLNYIKYIVWHFTKTRYNLNN